ncbi:hypothetical protein ABPG77_010237 [Micractinium sp. CCAP 211/92]
MSGAGLSLLQQEAYVAVCRAFYAQPALGWDGEDVLTKLRDCWNISNQTHLSITQEMRNDPDVVAVRNGMLPSRAGRSKVGIGGSAAPAPSLGMPPPPARQRHGAGASAGFADWSDGSDGGSPAVSDYSEESGRSRQRSHKRKAGGGGDRRSHKRKTPAPGALGSLAAAPSFRRASSARPGGPPMGLVHRSSSGLMQRARSTRQNGGYGGALDPMGYVGRRLWRYWPTENPPWVEGFVQQWDPDTDNYTIVYDPNTTAATEEVFNFASASENEYVLGEYVDMTAVHGSQRLPDKPYVSPDILAMPPPAGLLAALAPAPSKKRKSISGAPVPVDAPFEITYLNARLPVAGEDELQQMLAVLERKERIVEAEINILEYQEANREDIEKRAELERKFRELCDREAQLMAEIAALRQATAAV